MINPAHLAKIKYGYEPQGPPGDDEWQRMMSQQDFAKGQQDRQNQFEGARQANQLAFEAGQGEANRANQLSIAGMPWAYKNRVFDTVSPLLTSLAGGGQSPLVGGQNTPQGQITQGPVWTQQQIDQQVNNQKSNNARAANTQSQAAARSTAASGFGAASPLLQALQGTIQAQRMGADAAAERETNWNAAQGNAQQLLASQQAAERNWLDYNTTDIERRKANQQYQTSLLGILAGLA